MLATATQARADFKIGDEDTYLKIGALIQSWAALTGDAAPDGGTETELYLRRMRLMASGQTSEKVNFFFETDSPNFGLGGNHEVGTFIQDAWIELNLHRALQVDAGMLLVPFSHHGMQGATSLLTVDYHTKLLRYPLGSHKTWRDAGVMARGLLLNDILEYRIGVFNGVHGKADLVPKSGYGTSWVQPADPRNPSDRPRVTARVTVNAFEPEGGPGVAGYFYDGLYLRSDEDGISSPKKVLAFGVSVDWQKDLNPDWGPLSGTDAAGTPIRSVYERTDYYAAAADVFWDLPLSEDRHMALSGQIDGYYYNYGDRNTRAAWLNADDVDGKGREGMFTGYGVMAEAGFRYESIQPVVAFDWYDSTKAPGKLGDYVAVYGGFNYWFRGHETSLKVQAGASNSNDTKWIPAEIVQLQLLF